MKFAGSPSDGTCQGVMRSNRDDIRSPRKKIIAYSVAVCNPVVAKDFIYARIVPHNSYSCPVIASLRLG
jgi:hypothetical protein